MCGIFGIIAYADSKITTKKLESSVLKAFHESERRGKDSSGALSVTSKNMFVTKSPERGRDLVKTGEFKTLLKDSISSYLHGETFALFGHTRMATHGSADIYDNNQPIVAHQSVILHNGIIVNFEEIYTENPQLNKMYDVDSEVLISLINWFQNSEVSEFDSISKASDICQGANTFMYLNSKSSHIYLNSSNGSLYVFEDKLLGLYVFASERQTLEKIIFDLVDESQMHNIYRPKRNSPTVIALQRSIEVTACTAVKRRENAVLQEREIVIIGVSHSNNDSKMELQVSQTYEKMPKKFFESLPDTKKITRCKVCILPTTYPFLKFDTNGVCEFCKERKIFPQLGIEKFIDELEIEDNSRYLVPISGGRDSCYALHVLAKNLNLDLVAFTYDWGFVTDVARRNISRMCGELGIEHILVAADLKRKRKNVQLNVSAWLRKPHLGMIPLFMAGDKDFFKFATQIRQEMNLSGTIFGMTRFEPAGFKTGFAGINESKQHEKTFDLGISNKVKLGSFYVGQALKNPGYLNTSIFDSLSGYHSYYFRKKDYLQIFDYINWNENEVVSKIKSQYGWENSPTMTNTWRIGDASAPFYNYIYSYFAGFNENDVYLSNLIRDNQIDRDEAVRLLEEYNLPDEVGFSKYCELIGLSPISVIDKIFKSEGYFESIDSQRSL